MKHDREFLVKAAWAVESTGLKALHPVSGKVLRLAGEEAVVWELLFRKEVLPEPVSMIAAVLRIGPEQATERMEALLENWSRSGFIAARRSDV